MAITQDTKAPTAPKQAITPRGVNHIVLNVRDIEVSHRFYTEVLGFKHVAALKPKPDRPPLTMRFYSGQDEQGRVNHHDLALCQLPKGDAGRPQEWDLYPNRPGINHIAITLPDREAFLQQLAFLRDKGVKFHRRINHGMTHSVYISDPDGNGIEVLYELEPEVWEDIDAAQNYSERLPTEGDEAMVDRTDNPVFRKS
jgi:catechol 2,3-dioxygenase